MTKKNWNIEDQLSNLVLFMCGKRPTYTKIHKELKIKCITIKKKDLIWFNRQITRFICFFFYLMPNMFLRSEKRKEKGKKKHFVRSHQSMLYFLWNSSREEIIWFFVSLLPSLHETSQNLVLDFSSNWWKQLPAAAFFLD